MSNENRTKARRTFTPELKQQIVQLYHSGKRKCDILREYDIASSLLDRWIQQEESTGSFKEKDNRTPEQQELIELRKGTSSLKWRMTF